MPDVVRTDRIDAQMRREIGDIINTQLKDPRIASIVSVTRVEVTRDFRHAKVYISVYDADPDGEDACFRAIESAQGFIRREVGARIKLRVTPELHFVRDNSIAYGVRMSHLIDTVVSGDAKPETPDGKDGA